MKITHYSDIDSVTMNNEMVKNVTGRILIGKADGASNFCMRKFDIGPQGFTPRHAHDWEHEIFVLEGKGEIFIKDKWTDITQGTVVYVPPNEDHQIRNTGDKEFSFLCLVPPQAPEM
ncbi:MAG: cupin domain-containing protein [Desulfobacter sp.]|nr:cupin domain-containing protein [Desulfobacter sp.]